ncbi:helix-turn-helix domain-containing protein [Providencia manganoxydans]
MSSHYPKKLREIRLAEQLTQKQFSDLTGISLGSIKNYETGQTDVGLKVIDLVLSHPQFQKYTMWLMTDTVNPEFGQISPTLSPDGLDSTSKSQKGQKAG